MSKTATLNFGLTECGDGVNAATTFTPVVNSAAMGAVTPVNLSAGDNVIPVPAGAQGFIVRAPAMSTNAKSLSPAASVAGLPIGMAGDSPFRLGTGATNINVISTGSEQILVVWV